MGWRRLAEGEYNKVYINAEETEVFKVQLTEHDSDNPERSVRLWNLMNPDVYPERPARLHDDRVLGRGWICPYICGEQANDHDISTALLQIFNRTGRIILDALSRGNFIRTLDGQVVCVDIGMAVELERRDAIPSPLTPSSDRAAPEALTRKKSKTSLYIWATLQGEYNKYFEEDYATKHYPQTASIIKALLFIKIQRPDISNVDFLIDKPDLIALLVDAYSQSQLPDTKANQLTIGNALQTLDACASSTTLSSGPSAAAEGGGSAGAGGGEHAASPSRHGLGLFAPDAPTVPRGTERDETTKLGFF